MGEPEPEKPKAPVLINKNERKLMDQVEGMQPPKKKPRK